MNVTAPPTVSRSVSASNVCPCSAAFATSAAGVVVPYCMEMLEATCRCAKLGALVIEELVIEELVIDPDQYPVLARIGLASSSSLTRTSLA